MRSVRDSDTHPILNRRDAKDAEQREQRGFWVGRDVLIAPRLAVIIQKRTEAFTPRGAGLMMEETRRLAIQKAYSVNYISACNIATCRSSFLRANEGNEDTAWQKK